VGDAVDWRLMGLSRNVDLRRESVLPARRVLDMRVLDAVILRAAVVRRAVVRWEKVVSRFEAIGPDRDRSTPEP